MVRCHAVSVPSPAPGPSRERRDARRPATARDRRSRVRRPLPGAPRAHRRRHRPGDREQGDPGRRRPRGPARKGRLPEGLRPPRARALGRADERRHRVRPRLAHEARRDRQHGDDARRGGPGPPRRRGRRVPPRLRYRRRRAGRGDRGAAPHAPRRPRRRRPDGPLPGNAGRDLREETPASSPELPGKPVPLLRRGIRGPRRAGPRGDGRDARRHRAADGLRTARDGRDGVPPRGRGREASRRSDRADREAGRRFPPRRGSRSPRPGPRRGRGARRPLRHRRRSRPLRPGAPRRRWRLAFAGRRRLHDAPAGLRRRRPACARLGRRDALLDEPGRPVPPGLLRPHRLDRDLDVARPGDGHVRRHPFGPKPSRRIGQRNPPPFPHRERRRRRHHRRFPGNPPPRLREGLPPGGPARRAVRAVHRSCAGPSLRRPGRRRRPRVFRLRSAEGKARRAPDEPHRRHARREIDRVAPPLGKGESRRREARPPLLPGARPRRGSRRKGRRHRRRVHRAFRRLPLRGEAAPFARRTSRGSTPSSSTCRTPASASTPTSRRWPG